MIIEWGKLPESCRNAAEAWSQEYGSDVNPERLREAVAAVAVGMFVAQLSARKEEKERADKAERAVLEADEVLCGVCSHGEHEHEIECHADSLPDVYRHQAIGVEKAIKILSVIQHDIIDRKGLGG